MSLQTGGRPWGAISTRSRSASTASLSAWSVGTLPTVSPLGPTSRTSGTRIRSLMRSSVLILPPVVRVGGSRSRSSPRHVVEPVGKCRRLPLCAKREPVVTRLPLSGETAVPHPRRTQLWHWTGTRRSVVQGDRCGWETGGACLRLAGSVSQGFCGTDRSTRKVSGSFRPGANLRGDPPVTRSGARPVTVQRHQPPPGGQTGQVVAVDDVRRGAGEVGQQCLGTVLDGRGGRGGRGHRDRAGLRVPARHRRQRGERQQAGAPV